MPQNPTRFSNPRRQFLNAFGAVAVTMSPMACAIAAATSPGTIRLGVVLPESTRYPELPNDLRAGFEAFAASPDGSAIRLVPIAGGPGTDAAFTAASEAIKSGRVDVLAGLVNRNLARRMSPLLEASGTPFVVCDMGADVIRDRRDNAFLIRNSLGYWQANHAMGTWAPANLGKRALIATDFLEGGYDMVYAFRRAFEAAGGEVVGVQVTGLPNGKGAFSEVSDAMRSGRPDFVYAFYSGERARAFLRFYDSERLSRIAPLAGAALLTDAATISGLPRRLEGITTVSSWAADIQSPGNDALQSAHRRARGREAGVFAMLGYETAQRIAAGFAVEGASHGGARLAQALARVTFAGPRGTLAMHDALSETSTPAYVRRLRSSGDRMVNVTEARMPMDVSVDVAHELRAMIKTGWTQAYLTA